MNTVKALEILEIDNTANSKDIKKAYRRLAMLYHPDRNPNVYTQHQFIEISEAYEFLKSFKESPQQKTYNKDHVNKFRNKNHRNHFDYNSYQYSSKEDKSQRAKNTYEKEFAEQSDILYHKLFNKYKNSYQRKASIFVAIIGLLTITLFAYDFFTPATLKPHIVGNKNVIIKHIIMNLDTRFDLSLKINNNYYILTTNELLKLENHLLQNKGFGFANKETGFLHNNLGLCIVDSNSEGVVCEMIQDSNINDWLILIFALMSIPFIGLMFERPTFNFVFFIVNYNIYVFPIIFIYIITRSTPIFS